MKYSEELYQQVILDHNASPRNFYRMEGESHSCEGKNPLCGDEIKIYLKLLGGKIEEVSFEGKGCAISKSSASMMTMGVKGKGIEEVRLIYGEFHRMILGDNFDEGGGILGKLVIFMGVKRFPSRTKCATLCWHGLMCAIERRKEVSTE